jgi:hypothetical protein
MPVDTELAMKTWVRYAWARDNGHTQFIEKADKCDAYFRGDQWDRADKAALDAVRRPALTINKIISTVSNVMGEQIYNRSEIGFSPRSGSDPDKAATLTKVFKQISDNNQLDWKRSDMFADGIITSRGFLDVRIDTGDSMKGEVRIENLNPKNVVIDPDGEDYDPDTWSEVFTTKWVTADDIAVLYSKADAEVLRNREQSFFPFGYDSIQAFRDRFGDRFNSMYAGGYDFSSVSRNIRLIERQYRMLDSQQHFVSPETGDMRQIPEEFDRNKIAWFVEKFGFQVTKKLVRRIKWVAIADNVRLHDDWSPYNHFTVVPFFPHFRRGHTIGLVENLLGPQELLNKVSSQELHVVNTTANSGWKVKAGALTNMSIEELEQRGAQTGLVLETNEMDGIEKIQPNQVPTGLDRVTYKAEEHIKTISGVSDSMQGFDREDVAAKAIEKKRQAGATNLAKPLDNLTRSDYILARNVLDLVQNFYTEERIMTITHNETTGESDTFTVNQVTPEGQVLNDLTLGEYGVVITSVPHRETLEDSQFEQAVSLKELGISIPDDVLIENSRLLNKKDILKRMSDQANSPAAQAMQRMQERAQAAEVSKTEGEAAAKHADAGLKGAKTQETMVKAQVLANTPPDQPESAPDNSHEVVKTAHEMDLAEREFEHKRQMDFMEMGMQREQQANELQLREQEMQQAAADKRLEASKEAAVAAQKPQGRQPSRGLR